MSVGIFKSRINRFRNNTSCFLSHSYRWTIFQESPLYFWCLSCLRVNQCDFANMNWSCDLLNSRRLSILVCPNSLEFFIYSQNQYFIRSSIHSSNCTHFTLILPWDEHNLISLQYIPFIKCTYTLHYFS